MIAHRLVLSFVEKEKTEKNEPRTIPNEVHNPVDLSSITKYIDEAIMEKKIPASEFPRECSNNNDYLRKSAETSSPIYNDALTTSVRTLSAQSNRLYFVTQAEKKKIGKK